MTRSAGGGTAARMPRIRRLDELCELLRRHKGLYVRWSADPMRDSEVNRSSDELTGAALPGLSANSLDVEDWWGDRDLRLWAARRLYDYSHLREQRPGDVVAWVLVGRPTGDRGPDNEPLVRCEQVLAFIDEAVLDEANRLVRAEGARRWGPLNRGGGGR